ncbi:OLC1v1016048C1 [Oldenlandia corymbosa var. corymbosa]|uniref:OLC1v1016048C1 n=1 Tax=Oldenlandia corymbosa var. corymbosa TaxID=529605 RepID=A0AAV1E4K1_OLDCO|nr:OLC1v1016048C1 [Oldenlandia corymbosa var. corymbosa]
MAQMSFQSPLLLLISMMMVVEVLAEIAPSPCDPGPSEIPAICDKIVLTDLNFIHAVESAVRDLDMNLTFMALIQGEIGYGEGQSYTLLIQVRNGTGGVGYYEVKFYDYIEEIQELARPSDFLSPCAFKYC